MVPITMVLTLIITTVIIATVIIAITTTAMDIMTIITLNNRIGNTKKKESSKPFYHC